MIHLGASQMVAYVCHRHCSNLPIKSFKKIHTHMYIYIYIYILLIIEEGKEKIKQNNELKETISAILTLVISMAVCRFAPVHGRQWGIHQWVPPQVRRDAARVYEDDFRPLVQDPRLPPPGAAPRDSRPDAAQRTAEHRPASGRLQGHAQIPSENRSVISILSLHLLFRQV